MANKPHVFAYKGKRAIQVKHAPEIENIMKKRRKKYGMETDSDIYRRKYRK